MIAVLSTIACPSLVAIAAGAAQVTIEPSGQHEATMTRSRRASGSITTASTRRR
jgi:hypothetical protein